MKRYQFYNDGMQQDSTGDWCIADIAEAEHNRLREALECLIVGACAVGVPHEGERHVLQEAVGAAREALKGDSDAV